MEVKFSRLWCTENLGGGSGGGGGYDGCGGHDPPIHHTNIRNSNNSNNNNVNVRLVVLSWLQMVVMVATTLRSHSHN
jgi:hypothetical protein